jgi:hypothetical protein
VKKDYIMKLTSIQWRQVWHLMEDYNFTQAQAISLLEDHDWDYGAADRAMKDSRPDI